MLALHLLQSALVFVDTILVQLLLKDPAWAERLTDADRRALGPLFWSHAKPVRHHPDPSSPVVMVLRLIGWWVTPGDNDPSYPCGRLASVLEGFKDFDEFDIATSDTTIHGRRGGSGPPVLLLHGIPETHLMWHRVAPQLAEHFTVIATDLRGFGASGTPPSTPDHAPYSMRAIARDQVEVMRALGYEEFAVAGHDRGARCAYRMALDHPKAITRLAVLDIVPTGEAFGRADMDFALGYWVWSFLAAPEPVPERLIAAAPSVLVDHMLDSWSQAPDAFPPEVRAAYTAQFADPATVHAICEEYRAAATLDYEHDKADRGRQRIACPTLALWSVAGPVAEWYEPLKVWQAWADNVRGGPINAGHFIPEEAPDETARNLLDFLA